MDGYGGSSGSNRPPNQEHSQNQHGFRKEASDVGSAGAMNDLFGSRDAEFDAAGEMFSRDDFRTAVVEAPGAAISPTVEEKFGKYFG